MSASGVKLTLQARFPFPQIDFGHEPMMRQLPTIDMFLLTGIDTSPTTVILFGRRSFSHVLKIETRRS
jgi:hypothetical protein